MLGLCWCTFDYIPSIGRGRSEGRCQKKERKQMRLREQSACLLSSVHTHSSFVFKRTGTEFSQFSWRWWSGLLKTYTWKKPTTPKIIKLLKLVWKNNYWVNMLSGDGSSLLWVLMPVRLTTGLYCTHCNAVFSLAEEKIWWKGHRPKIPLLYQTGLSQILCYLVRVPVFITTFIERLWGLSK